MGASANSRCGIALLRPSDRAGAPFRFVAKIVLQRKSQIVGGISLRYPTSN